MDEIYLTIGFTWRSTSSGKQRVFCLEVGSPAEAALTDRDVHEIHAFFTRLAEEGDADSAHACQFLLRLLVDRGRDLSDAEAVAGEAVRLAEVFEAASRVYPGAIQAAYENYDWGCNTRGCCVLESFSKPCQLPLFRLHLENGAAQYCCGDDEDLVHLQDEDDFANDPACADALEMLDENIRVDAAWHESARCAWITCCNQLGISAESEEEHAASSLNKRRVLL